MKTISRTRYYSAPALDVFHALDDLGVTGSHMTTRSGMMMGNKLDLHYLSPNKTGLNSKYRWTGKMMGISMDFTVLVTNWIEGKEKTWETIGEVKLLIYDWYRMHLAVEQEGEMTKAMLSISYERPASIFGKILSFLFARIYCIWCLNNMLDDAGRSLKANGVPAPAAH